MNKINTLRTALQAALPELKADPARLRMWIERGEAQSRQTATRGFAFAYQLNILIIEFATDIAVLALALFDWLRVNQPDLLAPGATGFSFDVDILDNETADVLVQLNIAQNISAAPQPDGSTLLTYLDEPDPLFDDFLGAGGADPVPVLTQVNIAGEGVVLPDDPAS